MAPNFDEPKPPKSKVDLARLKELFEAAGLTRARVEHTSARTTSHGSKITRGWSEVLCHNPEARGQSQVAHCCDPDDADFIGAIINAFPFIVEELERNQPPPPLTDYDKLKLISNLKYVVQYRRTDGLHGWIAMVAYDVDTLAISYCDECNVRPRPWAYRVVSLETGETVHEPQPKDRADG